MWRDVLNKLRELGEWKDGVNEALATLQSGMDTLLERVAPAAVPEHLKGQQGVAHANVEITPRGVWLHLKNLDDLTTFHFQVDPVGWAAVDEKVRLALQKWSQTRWVEKGGGEA